MYAWVMNQILNIHSLKLLDINFTQITRSVPRIFCDTPSAPVSPAVRQRGPHPSGSTDSRRIGRTGAGRDGYDGRPGRVSVGPCEHQYLQRWRGGSSAARITSLARDSLGNIATGERYPQKLRQTCAAERDWQQGAAKGRDEGKHRYKQDGKKQRQRSRRIVVKRNDDMGVDHRQMNTLTTGYDWEKIQTILCINTMLVDCFLMRT